MKFALQVKYLTDMKYLLSAIFEIVREVPKSKFNIIASQRLGNFTIRQDYFILVGNISLFMLKYIKGNDMKKNKLVDLSMTFAVETLRLCESIKGHSSLVNQLERSSTSVGANIHEANYAHSKLDFIAKLQISLKECYETEYWLGLFVKSGILQEEAIKDIFNQCGTICRLLIASINTAKGNNQTPD